MIDLKYKTTMSDEQKQKLITAGKGRISVQIMTEIQNDIIPAIGRLIDICGGDPFGDGQRDTPYRVVKAWYEMSEGYTEEPYKHLSTSFDLDEGDMKITKGNDDLVIVENITVKSVCEHHILPFIGVLHIGYIPNEKVLGLSKFARLAKGYSKRFQIQEKLGAQVANDVMKYADAKGVIVYISAVHTCMIARGVEEHETNTITVATRGVFRDDKMLEQKFLTVIGGKR